MQRQIRKYTSLVLDFVDQGVLDQKTLIRDLLCWMDESEVKEFCEKYELIEEEEDETDD